jgi:DNA-binding response OmpR family regulator
VDDDSLTLDALRAGCEAAGFELICAQDGRSALRLAMRERPDLIILDGSQPAAARLEVVREVRQNTLVSHVPIMILACGGTTEDVVLALDAGADDFLHKPFDLCELMARIKSQLRRSCQERSFNPLTGLPGNVTIEAEFKRLVAAKQPFAVIYADIDNFKSVNDAYGFLQGDEGIRLLAAILLDAVRKFGHPCNFVGHVGGDDFVVCTTPDKVDAICQHIIRLFTDQVPFLYHPLDRTRGFVAGVNRQGQAVRHAVATISLAVVTNERRAIESHWEIGEITAELKRAAKQIPHSIYIKDLRGTGEGQEAPPTERPDFSSLPPAALVTDDSVLRLVSPTIFKRHGFTVCICDSWAEATNLSPAVLIIDSEMRAVDGEAVLAWIKAGRAAILLGSRLDDLLRGLSLGAVAKLEKPVNLSTCAEHLGTLYRPLLARPKVVKFQAAVSGEQ